MQLSALVHTHSMSMTSLLFKTKYVYAHPVIVTASRTTNRVNKTPRAITEFIIDSMLELIDDGLSIRISAEVRVHVARLTGD